jgi:hypothetical protein
MWERFGRTPARRNALLTDGGTGAVHVTLDDTGPVGTYTAADAMRLTTGTCT